MVVLDIFDRCLGYILWVSWKYLMDVLDISQSVLEILHRFLSDI